MNSDLAAELQQLLSEVPTAATLAHVRDTYGHLPGIYESFHLQCTLQQATCSGNGHKDAQVYLLGIHRSDVMSLADWAVNMTTHAAEQRRSRGLKAARSGPSGSHRTATAVGEQHRTVKVRLAAHIEAMLDPILPIKSADLAISASETGETQKKMRFVEPWRAALFCALRAHVAGVNLEIDQACCRQVAAAVPPACTGGPWRAPVASTTKGKVMSEFCQHLHNLLCPLNQSGGWTHPGTAQSMVQPSCDAGGCASTLARCVVGPQIVNGFVYQKSGVHLPVVLGLDGKECKNGTAFVTAVVATCAWIPDVCTPRGNWVRDGYCCAYLTNASSPQVDESTTDALSRHVSLQMTQLLTGWPETVYVFLAARHTSEKPQVLAVQPKLHMLIADNRQAEQVMGLSQTACKHCVATGSAPAPSLAHDLGYWCVRALRATFPECTSLEHLYSAINAAEIGPSLALPLLAASQRGIPMALSGEPSHIEYPPVLTVDRSRVTQESCPSALWAKLARHATLASVESSGSSQYGLSNVAAPVRSGINCGADLHGYKPVAACYLACSAIAPGMAFCMRPYDPLHEMGSGAVSNALTSFKRSLSTDSVGLLRNRMLTLPTQAARGRQLVGHARTRTIGRRDVDNKGHKKSYERIAEVIYTPAVMLSLLQEHEQVLAATISDILGQVIEGMAQPSMSLYQLSLLRERATLLFCLSGLLPTAKAPQFLATVTAHNLLHVANYALLHGCGEHGSTHVVEDLQKWYAVRVLDLVSQRAGNSEFGEEDEMLAVSRRLSYFSTYWGSGRLTNFTLMDMPLVVLSPGSCPVKICSSRAWLHAGLAAQHWEL